ncbi:hypothetical protein TNCV_3018501, partial [Trichonephila clavipes]
MANAFWVSVRNNISKRWNTTENDVSKNPSSADSAIRLPNTNHHQEEEPMDWENVPFLPEVSVPFAPSRLPRKMRSSSQF